MIRDGCGVGDCPRPWRITRRRRVLGFTPLTRPPPNRWVADPVVIPRRIPPLGIAATRILGRLRPHGLTIMRSTRRRRSCRCAGGTECWVVCGDLVVGDFDSWAGVWGFLGCFYFSRLRRWGGGGNRLGNLRIAPFDFPRRNRRAEVKIPPFARRHLMWSMWKFSVSRPPVGPSCRDVGRIP